MSEDHPDPLAVTVEEAAALLGVSRSTGYEPAASGELPTLRLRRRIVVPAARLADMLGISAWEVVSAVRPATELQQRGLSDAERRHPPIFWGAETVRR